MDYRILGPLDVCVDGHALALGGEKQRALLAILLLHANEAVSVDRLIEGIWGEQLPRSAHKTLQGYIYRLRKVLENGGSEAGATANGAVLVTSATGYLLRVADGELDLDRFKALVERARRVLAVGDPGAAATLLRDALRLWRGPALADLAYETFAQPAIAQLEELRLAALEDRIDADLALGLDRDLVGELSALVEHNPLRERLRGQLMVALYRGGREAEALEAYQHYRRRLSEQLGLDPSPALRELEASILSRDPTLDLRDGRRTTSTRAAGGAPVPLPAATNRRRWVPALVATVLAAVAAVAAAAVVVTSAGGGSSDSAIAADAVGALNPSTGSILAQAPIGSSPTSAAAGDGAVWVTAGGNTVSRIDQATGAVTQAIPVGSNPSGVAVGAGAVWVANNLSDNVSRIDPTARRVVQTIPVGNAPAGIAVGYRSVWVTNSSDGTITRVDDVTGTAAATIPAGGGVNGVATGYGSVWVSDETAGRVLRIDPRSNQVAQTIGVGTGPTAIAAGDGAVWVANSQDGTVSKIDPRTNAVAATIAVGDGPDAIAIGAGGVWVANEFGGTLSLIDPASDAVARTTRLGNSPRGLAISDGQLWFGAQAPITSHRGGTLVVLSHGPFGTVDPASPTVTIVAGLTLQITNDGLTAFKRIGGSEGVQVVPDLAASLPAPTDGGLTYTFQLRNGIRYSNGQLVRPSDIPHEFERLFALKSWVGPAEYTGIVGAAECLARPARCDLAHGIVADNAANTVTFHLVAPDPEFLDRLALGAAVAVPTATPVRDLGTHPLPATGPYEIISDTPREVVLVRNPYFHEWSPQARPDGYPNRIVWLLGGSGEAAVTAVERGTADYTFDSVPPNRLQEVQTQFASQLNVNPNPVTDSLFLNTRLAPFNDIRVRRALNYAVDRAEVARILGADSQPTCQQLAPYIPGYERYCPYTLDPSAAGLWRGPDMARARALIAASGTRGDAITIWSQPNLFIPDYDPVGRYLVSLLNRLGYRARLKSVPADDQAFAPQDSRQKIQASLAVYYGAYPAASDFIGPRWISCQSFQPNSPNNLNVTELCDPQLDAIERNALAAETTSLPDAAAVWAQADRRLTDDAAVVNLVNPSTLDFVSRRVGNYQYNPEQGVLIDQLWVR
jgi:peptide/nickel transport system substrate-binding protein